MMKDQQLIQLNIELINNYIENIKYIKVKKEPNQKTRKNN